MNKNELIAELKIHRENKEKYLSATSHTDYIKTNK